MVLRRAASAIVATEKNSRRITGYEDLWRLKAILLDGDLDTQEKVA